MMKGNASPFEVRRLHAAQFPDDSSNRLSKPCRSPQESAPVRSQGHALLDRECRARQLEVRARVLFSPEPEPEPEPKSNLDGTRRRRR